MSALKATLACDGPVFAAIQAIQAERDQLRVDLELADVMYQRECEVEHELRTEVERLRSDRDCEKRLRKDADEFRENAIERAVKAEANLAALEQSFDDNCRGVAKIADDLAKERARLEKMRTLLTASNAKLALIFGELTAGESRTVRAVLKYVLSIH